MQGEDTFSRGSSIHCIPGGGILELHDYICNYKLVNYAGVLGTNGYIREPRSGDKLESGSPIEYHTCTAERTDDGSRLGEFRRLHLN